MQVLFQNAPDLLEEFKQFLPDPAQQQQQQFQQQQQPMKVPGAPVSGPFPVRAPPKRPAFAPTGPPAKRPRGTAPIRFARAYAQQFGTIEEFEFFERVKKAIANRTTYSEFLKVLNLFNQDILDPKLLVERVEPFLGRWPDLYAWFKNYVKYDDKDDALDPTPTPAPPRDMTGAKRSGSSYRLLPVDVVHFLIRQLSYFLVSTTTLCRS